MKQHFLFYFVFGLFPFPFTNSKTLACSLNTQTWGETQSVVWSPEFQERKADWKLQTAAMKKSKLTTENNRRNHETQNTPRYLYAKEALILVSPLMHSSSIYPVIILYQSSVPLLSHCRPWLTATASLELNIDSGIIQQTENCMLTTSYSLIIKYLRYIIIKISFYLSENVPLKYITLLQTTTRSNWKLPTELIFGINIPTKSKCL